MDKIAYEDFAKIELKVAKILEAEKIEGATKLVKLRISLGTEERQLVAGIAEFYSPDELIGKKIVAVTNLEPRKIKGIESNGMLLAAEDEIGLSLVSVDSDVIEGSEVH